MSKLIALVIGSYGGAVIILVLYVLAVALDPFELKCKKGTTAANSRVQK